MLLAHGPVEFDASLPRLVSNKNGIARIFCWFANAAMYGMCAGDPAIIDEQVFSRVHGLAYPIPYRPNASIIVSTGIAWILPMPWFLLALSCAASVAAADTLTKRFLVGKGIGEMLIIRSSIPVLLMSPLLVLQDIAWPPSVFWWWVLPALPLEILAEATYVRAIRASPLYLTLPMLAITPLSSALAAYGLLGEALPLRGAIGILLLVMGVYALNIELARAKQPLTWLAPLTALATSSGTRLMLLVVCLWSLTAVLAKGAMAYMAAPGFAVIYVAMVGLANLLFWGIREAGGVLRIRHASIWVWLVAGLMALSYLTHYAALAKAEVAYMIAVKRTSILFGILFGAMLLGEKRPWQHLFAGLVILTGLIFLVSVG